MNGDQVVCSLHDLPGLVEEALAARYETLQSSLAFFRVWRCVDGAGCYMARRDGRIAEVLVFRREGRELVVLNEMIDIEPAGLQCFARHMFEQLPDIGVIRFPAVDAGRGEIGYPVQRHNAKDTFVIALPDTPEAYLAALGKSTRANLRSRLNHVNKHLPSFATRLVLGADIREEDVRAIAAFSEQRIGRQGLALRHDTARMTALARECGFVVLLLIDGRLCAGSVNYRVGASVFGEVTAHDPAFEREGLGALCVYLTVCEAIRAGARKFYLGGGAFAFKERMLGRRVDMDQLRIYRSRAAAVAHLDLAAAAFAQGQLRRLKRTLHAHKGGAVADAIFRMFYAAKSRIGK